MSKHYRIKFSKKDETFNAMGPQGQPVALSTREIEKRMLCNLFDIAGARAKTIKDNRIAADNYANVDAVQMDQEGASVVFTEEDLKQLVDAHNAASAGDGRPVAWNRLRLLISQLESPEEIEVK